MQQMLTEAKNLHMEHIEDNILNGGVDGTRQTINFLRELRDMLSGRTREKVNVSVKWDGAPSIFAGTDPRDGKFFVAKKSIFNKEPKIYKSIDEIDADLKGDLREKFVVAFRELQKIGIDGILQGDLLYTRRDLRIGNIHGEKYLTFHPNTIVYAVPMGSDLAKQIRRSKIGVVWHTKYSGSDFESLKAQYNQSIVDQLKKDNDVWFTDAEYRDVSGLASMTGQETTELTLILSELGKTFSTVDRKSFNFISDNNDYLIRLKTFINSTIREGEMIKDPAMFVDKFSDYVRRYYKNEMGKRKTIRGQQAVEVKYRAVMDNVDQDSLVKIMHMYNLVIAAKTMLINKLNSANGLGTFLLTNKGYQVTNQEGFVASDRLGSTAVKLVDRLEFSYSNFSKDVIKGFER